MSQRFRESRGTKIGQLPNMGMFSKYGHGLQIWPYLPTRDILKIDQLSNMGMFSKYCHGFQIWSCPSNRQIKIIWCFLQIDIPLKCTQSKIFDIHECWPYIVIPIWLIKVCLTQSADLSVFVLFFLFFLLRSARRSLQTFLFLFCFFFFFIILFYFSLQPPACCDFSIISQPISMKFGMLIVLDETNRLNIFSSQ